MEFYYLLSLAIAAGIGLIPANIAKKKGYSFGLWWFYGWMLGIVAIIHVSLIEDKNSHKNIKEGLSVADELKKYKDLYDQGVINSEEFQAKKEELLKLI